MQPYKCRESDRILAGRVSLRNVSRRKRSTPIFFQKFPMKIISLSCKRGIKDELNFIF